MPKILRIFLFVALIFPALCFAEDLELSFAVPKGSLFVKPLDKTFTIKEQPMPFSVILTNRSKSSQRIYWETDSGYTKSLSFEMIDEFGNISMIKRKEFPAMSVALVNTYLGSDASVTKTMIMDPDEWDNLSLIEPGKVKKFRARAVYNNDGHTIYSDYYTLILDGNK